MGEAEILGGQQVFARRVRLEDIILVAVEELPLALDGIVQVDAGVGGVVAGQLNLNNAQQSLFGGDTGTTDITPPVIPACAEWSQLEKLNKEREVIGLYLSAHPLDDYKVIIRNMCKTQVGDLDHLDELKGKEIAVAGMVVGVQNLMTKTGKPWCKFKLEDYNGAHEFALFGKDYENFRKYLFSDYFLFIR